MAKLKDLTLTPNFTYLTVIERAPNIGRYVSWKCRCKCGNEIVVRSTDLVSGNTKSCGCYKIQRTKEALTKDITGQRFGRLVVINDTGERTSNKQRVLLCQCDCGATSKQTPSQLKSGVQSCGCSKSKGEELIANLLTEHKIEFAKEYTFSDFRLTSGGVPRFDFAVFNDGVLSHLIEYDGIQHFEYTGLGWNTKENFERTQQRDLEKNNYCKINNIKLIRIKYNEGVTIERLLLHGELDECSPSIKNRK